MTEVQCLSLVNSPSGRKERKDVVNLGQTENRLEGGLTDADRRRGRQPIQLPHLVPDGDKRDEMVGRRPIGRPADLWLGRALLGPGPFVLGRRFTPFLLAVNLVLETEGGIEKVEASRGC